MLNYPKQFHYSTFLFVTLNPYVKLNHLCVNRKTLCFLSKRSKLTFKQTIDVKQYTQIFLGLWHGILRSHKSMRRPPLAHPIKLLTYHFMVHHHPFRP